MDTICEPSFIPRFWDFWEFLENDGFKFILNFTEEAHSLTLFSYWYIYTLIRMYKTQGVMLWSFCLKNLW